MSYESFGRDLASKGQKSVKCSPIGLEHQRVLTTSVAKSDDRFFFVSRNPKRPYQARLVLAQRSEFGVEAPETGSVCYVPGQVIFSFCRDQLFLSLPLECIAVFQLQQLLMHIPYPLNLKP